MLSQVPSGGQPAKAPGRSTAIEVLTGFAQVAIAIAAWTQLQSPRAWWILGLGFVWLGVAFGPRSVGLISRRARLRHDDRVARRTLPKLRALADSAAKLVRADTSDTLQAALQEGLREHLKALEHFQIPPAHMFFGMFENLYTRLAEERADLPHLIRARDELETILIIHSERCVQPVFRSMPADLQALLSSAGRSALNQYRERYVHFLERYGDFAEELLGSLKSRRLAATPLLRPKPLEKLLS